MVSRRELYHKRHKNTKSLSREQLYAFKYFARSGATLLSGFAFAVGFLEKAEGFLWALECYFCQLLNEHRIKRMNAIAFFTCIMAYEIYDSFNVLNYISLKLKV
jgi:hypothetical protein